MTRSDTANEPELQALCERLQGACLARRLSVTTAESCTGGGVASAITDIAGSSGYFETGYVTYSNAAKTRLLGVPKTTLDVHGAVSRETVKSMVAGACHESGADVGVAISGVAGPEGGSTEKPVGMVWFAWGNAQVQHAECLCFEGDRRTVRGQAVRVALEGLVRWLEEA